MVKRILLVLHEDNVYRQDIDVLSHFVAQSFDTIQTGGILLCSDDEFGREHCCKRVVDELDILLVELMMVGKCQRLQMVNMGRQVMQELFRRGNARQEQCMCVAHIVDGGNVPMTGLEHGLQCCVIQRGEIQTLVREAIHSLGDDTILHRLQVLGALGHDDDVGTVLTA